jgi:hypothetical protein
MTPSGHNAQSEPYTGDGQGACLSNRCPMIRFAAPATALLTLLMTIACTLLRSQHRLPSTRLQGGLSCCRSETNHCSVTIVPSESQASSTHAARIKKTKHRTRFTGTTSSEK